MNFFTPLTPNDSRLTFDSTKKAEDLKLMHIYQFCGHAM